jgi:ABC-type oligopeptide transport system substrate-binding subunit
MTPRSSAAALAAVATCAALAAGCAPTSSSKTDVGKFKGAQRPVAQAVSDFQTAATNGDEERICSTLLARSLVSQLTAHGKACPAVVHEAIRDADTVDLTVQSVQVDGDKATARVKLETGKKDRAATLGLVRENGTWRIATL